MLRQYLLASGRQSENGDESTQSAHESSVERRWELRWRSNRDEDVHAAAKEAKQDAGIGQQQAYRISTGASW
jgi:hypothetical protein